MSDVQETLQQLVERRLREMGARHGRTKPLSLLEAYRAIPEGALDDPVSYEVARRVLKSGHRNIGDRAADTLATMLAVPVGDVLRAAEKRPRLGPFTLPRRADRLNEAERAVVLDVVDAILDAGEGQRDADGDEAPPDRRTPIELYLAAAAAIGSEREDALAELERRGLPADPADLVVAVEGVLADARNGVVTPSSSRDDERPPVELYAAARAAATPEERKAALDELRRRRLPDDLDTLRLGVEVAAAELEGARGVAASDAATGDELGRRRRGSELPPLDELAARRGTREDQDPSN